MDRRDKDEPLSKRWESKSVEKKGTANDPRSSVKHGGGGEVLSWHGHAWLSLEQALSTLLMT